MKTAFLTLVLCVVLVSGAQGATISGKAIFEGAPPAAETFKMDADPSCKLLHPDGVGNDAVIVNANGTLKNVFIYVKEGVTGKYDTPKEPVIFDQLGCQYSPKVFGVQTNQPIEIRNSDSTLHNVHALPTQSQAFNLGMPIKGMKLKKTFAKPEVMVKIKCEVHPWMSAYVGVLDHPFFATSGDDGSFTIKGVPPGKYTIEAWHEKFGTQTKEVTIAADPDAAAADFNFKA